MLILEIKNFSRTSESHVSHVSFIIILSRFPKINFKGKMLRNSWIFKSYPVTSSPHTIFMCACINNNRETVWDHSMSALIGRSEWRSRIHPHKYLEVGGKYIGWLWIHSMYNKFFFESIWEFKFIALQLLLIVKLWKSS